MQRRHFHEITVNRPVSEAFPLFTPRGEEAWVLGWSPTYIRPESGEACEDMVFITDKGVERSIWTCLSWHARYLRVTPDSRVAFVDVRCTPEGRPDRTRVGVGYEIVALADHGRSYLETFTETEVAKSIDAWADMIHAMG